jgi:hypothetical protein
VLTEIEPSLLRQGVLPELWDGDVLTLPRLAEYFSGKQLVTIKKPAGDESVLIPQAEPDAILNAVVGAVRNGSVWLVNGTITVFGEEVSPALVNADAQLLPPPPPVSATDLLPDRIPSAWTGGETDAHRIHLALSHHHGRPMPWSRVSGALNDAFRVGLLVRTLDSGAWPSDAGGAAAVKISLRATSVDAPSMTAFHPRAVLASADLETHEVQELADRIDSLREATAGHTLRIRVVVEVGEDDDIDRAVRDQVNGILGEIKAGWHMA